MRIPNCLSPKKKKVGKLQLQTAPPKERAIPSAPGPVGQQTVELQVGFLWGKVEFFGGKIPKGMMGFFGRFETLFLVLFVF